MRGRELETEAREGTGRNDDGGDGEKRRRRGRGETTPSTYLREPDHMTNLRTFSLTT